MKKIAIIGATGMLGQPVTEEFLNAGYEVSIFVRNPTKAQKLFGEKVNITTGNLTDVARLKKFLEKQDFLYLNLSVKQESGEHDFQPEREGLANILKAAKETSLPRIGYLSSLVHFYQGQHNFDWWVFRLKADAVYQIKSSGIPYSIFYPSTFMESFGKGAYRQGNNLLLSGTSKYKMYLISGSDYGKQVIRAFEHHNGNNEYTIQGQEGYTADEAATLFADHYPKAKIRIIRAPFGLLKFLGKFTNKFNYAANIIEALNNYPEKFDAEKTWQELGTPPTKFLDYIKKCP